MTTDENEQEGTPALDPVVMPPEPPVAPVEPVVAAGIVDATVAEAVDAGAEDVSAPAAEAETGAAFVPGAGVGRGPAPSGDRGPRRDAGDGERPARRHFGRRRVCAFCADKVTSIDYKDAMRLRRFLSDRARIEPRRKTGTCAKHQRWLASALKRARHLAMLPYTPEHIRTSGVSTGRGR